MSSETSEYIFKVIIIGDAGVGKTSLALRYAKDTFREEYIVSLGVNFLYKETEIEGHKVRIQIWDTGGQERFSALRPKYYEGADAGVICYEITSKSTFESVKKYLEEIRRYCGDIPIALVATKIDLEDRREVSSEEGKKFASEHGLSFFETSAKEAINVNDVFQFLAEEVYYRLKCPKTK